MHYQDVEINFDICVIGRARGTYQEPPLPRPSTLRGVQVRPIGVERSPITIPKKAIESVASLDPAGWTELQHWTLPVSHCDDVTEGVGDATTQRAAARTAK